MNNIEDIHRVLPAALELAAIQPDEYILVGSAAEFIAGFTKDFRNIDIWVPNSVFEKALKQGLEVKTRYHTRVISIGYVDIFESSTKYFLKPKRENAPYTMLKNMDMIGWRLIMGSPKDKLRVWEITHHLYASLRQIMMENPESAAINGLTEMENVIFKIQKHLIEN